ncbi:MAG: hypothetical protein M3P08_16060 [Thermoproteota archaeon]|nr:hypothetical protein [Thermoproteota archaeon]
MSNNSEKRKEIESEVYDELLSTEVLDHDEQKNNNDNKRIGPKTILLTIFVGVVTLSSIIIISQTQAQLYAKKSSNSSSSTTSSSSSTEGGKGSPGGGALGGRGDNSSSSSSGLSDHHSQVDPTHCDQPGYPSCYSIGYSDGQNAPGTSCPSGHSHSFCAGWNAGYAADSPSSGGSQSSNSPPTLNGGTGSGTGSSGAAIHNGFKSTLKQSSKVNLNHLGQTNTLANITNSIGSHVNGKSNIHNNANVNSDLPSLLSGHKSKGHNPSSYQNSNVNINQTGHSNSNLVVTNSSGNHVNSKSNIGNNAHVTSKLPILLSSHHKSKGHTLPSTKQNSEVNVNQTGQSNTNLAVTNSSHSHVNSKSSIGNNAKVNSNLNNPTSSSHTTYHYDPSSIKQNSKVNVNQAALTNTNINLTNSPHSRVNSQSSIGNNAKVNSNLNNPTSSSHTTYPYDPSSSSPPLTQNSKTTVNQGAENNANINVNNSPGTHILNEQTIKQSVRVNNEVNNIIKNNEVNKVIQENTASSPQLTDIVTVKLGKSSMSSGALFPLADVAPYRLIGGHLTANLPSSSQQNIVVAQVSDNGKIEHAVILDLNQIIGSNLDQNSLYETSLGSDISGTNPFTGNQDEVSSITNLFLWNNNQQSIVFDDANGVTMNLIYK